MKRTWTIIKITCCFMLFVSLSILPVTARATDKRNTPTPTPTPNYKSHNAIYIGRTHLPYYGANVIVEQYLYGGRYYSEDLVSRQIVEIVPEQITYKIDPTFSIKELRTQAEEFISVFLGDRVKLKSLYYESGKKIGTYFFRWQDKSKYLDDETFPFIQVGLSQNGDFLNFVNTLPFGHADKTENVWASSVSLKLPPVSQVYANGGHYWRMFGDHGHLATGGWYALHPDGCRGALCSKFYWSTISSCPICYVNGVWRPRMNASTKVAVFIPSTHATAVVHYLVVTDDGSYLKIADQNIFFNTWLDISPAASKPGIRRVELDNFFGTEGLDVAWDELWAYSP